MYLLCTFNANALLYHSLMISSRVASALVIAAQSGTQFRADHEETFIPSTGDIVLMSPLLSEQRETSNPQIDGANTGCIPQVICCRGDRRSLPL
jgi:hypothetical protein